MRDIASVVGLKVISSKEGRSLGTVSQVVVDLASGDLLGLIIGTGPAEKGIEASDISVIGADAVMVGTSKAAVHVSDLPDLVAKRVDPSSQAREVVTDTGKRLGVLGTIYIDPVAKKVSRYEVSGGTWRDITEGVFSLSPTSGTVDGHGMLVVPAEALSDEETGASGLKAQLAKLGEVAREQARQASESLDRSAKGVKEGIAHMGENATQAAEELQRPDQREKPDAEGASGGGEASGSQSDAPSDDTNTDTA